MNKAIIAIVIIAVVVSGGYFLLKDSRPSSENAPVVSVGGEDSVPLIKQPASQPSMGQVPAAEKEQVVIYTDAGYSPTTITIKKGEAVIFKNQSSRSMWTASATHPTHRVYPTTGGCLGSTFDACKGVQTGDVWSFKFDVSGAWKYHDHLSPGDRGEIIVQ